MVAELVERDDLPELTTLIQMDADDLSALRQIGPAIKESVKDILDAVFDEMQTDPDLRDLLDGDEIDAARQLHMDFWVEALRGEFGPEFHSLLDQRAHADQTLVEPTVLFCIYAKVLEDLVTTVVQNSSRTSKTFLRRTVPGPPLAPQLAALVKAALLDMEFSYVAYRDRQNTHRQDGQMADQMSLDKMTDAFESLAQGNLAVRVVAQEFRNNERLAAAFNAAVSNLRDLIGETRNSADGIRSGSSEIAQATDDLARRTEQQAASLEETSAAVVSLNTAVKDTANSAKETNVTVAEALDDARAGGDVLNETQAAMTQIEASSKEMSKIISTIDEIAFQTNLLALNAGVEAARAGEAGKGFAVVASEVRTLAQRSAEAAKSIKSLIGTSSSHVASGVQLVQNTSDVLMRTIHAFGQVSQRVNAIAEATETQANSIAEINTAIGYLDEMTQQNAAMVEQSSAAAASLATEADSLSGHVSSFKLVE